MRDDGEEKEKEGERKFEKKKKKKREEIKGRAEEGKEGRREC